MEVDDKGKRKISWDYNKGDLSVLNGFHREKF